VHSFSRIFTGAFLDALAAMLIILGPANDANLLAVSGALGQLLVDGIHTAPITPAYFSQVASAMIQADQARHHGRYRTALSNAFVQHGILSLTAIAALAHAPVPQLAAVPADLGTTVGMGGMGGFSGRANGNRVLLTYEGREDDGYRRGPEDAPELPVHTVSTNFGMTLLVYAPSEPERFGVTPAVLSGGAAATPAPEEVAHAFVEDLIQLGRIDLRSVQGRVPAGLSAPSGDRSRKTHVVQETPEGLMLKRLHFDCGFHGCA
jgi:hypothetical protein